MFRLPLLALAASLTLAAVPPGPAVVSDGPAGDGLLVVTPPLSQVAIAAGEGATVPLQVHNGSDRTVDLVVTAVDAAIGADGAVTATDRRAGAGSWVTLAADSLQLAPGEIADLAAAVNVPEGATSWGAAAVRFHGEGAEVAAVISVDPAGGRPELSASVQLAADPRRAHLRVSLTNSGDASALVAGRVQVSSWLGRVVIDEELDAVLVAAGTTRQLELVIRPPALPGHYRTSVVFGDGSLEARASASAFLWNRLAAAGVGTLLLTVTGWLVARRLRARAAGAEA